MGYVDPGNWATDLAAGSAYGSALLPIVLLSGLAAILLQQLAARLGIVAGVDLAEACAQRYGRVTRLALWLLAEAGIIACDLAEVVGAAIALELLFGLPLIVGIWITAFDVLLLLALQRKGMAQLTAATAALVAIIALCFLVELFLARPSWPAVIAGSAGVTGMATDPTMLLLAIGIVGATVMPHNLYLHSALVKGAAPGTVRQRLRTSMRENARALGLAALVNAAILIVAAATFHARGLLDVTEIVQAHHLLAPLLGSVAATLFAVALLASGQSSTFTGTLAGQVVLEGFTQLRMAPWQRRVVSRLLAIVPAAITVSCFGSHATASLLVLSQVALSIQLPFAMIPLVLITSDTRTMGPLANGPILKAAAWTLAAVITVMDLGLLIHLCS